KRAWNRLQESAQQKLTPVHRLPLCPQISVERTVLDGLREMFRRKILVTGKVADGPGNFQNPIVATRRKTELGYGVLHDLFAIRTERAMLAKVLGAHLSIRVDLVVVEAPQLNIARRDHSRA